VFQVLKTRRLIAKIAKDSTRTGEKRATGPTKVVILCGCVKGKNWATCHPWIHYGLFLGGEGFEDHGAIKPEKPFLKELGGACQNIESLIR